MENIIAYFTDRKDKKIVELLENIDTKSISVVDAFELGLELRYTLDIEQECSSTGLSESELEEAIEYIKQVIH